MRTPNTRVLDAHAATHLDVSGKLELSNLSGCKLVRSFSLWSGVGWWSAWEILVNGSLFLFLVWSGVVELGVGCGGGACENDWWVVRSVSFWSGVCTSGPPPLTRHTTTPPTLPLKCGV
jgi:hypothetical protein